MRTSKLTKARIAQAIIAELEENDSDIGIETGLLSSYTIPGKIMWKSNNEGYLPDIKTSTSNKHINLYEIELSNKIDKSKWRLFSLFAKLNHGVFTVVVPEINISSIETFIVENNFNNTRLVYIPNKHN